MHYFLVLKGCSIFLSWEVAWFFLCPERLHDFFGPESPCPLVCLFVCLSVCLRHCVQFFLRGLSLALRSHDQFQASYWSPPNKIKKITKLLTPLPIFFLPPPPFFLDPLHFFLSVSLSALVKRVGASRMRDFFKGIRKMWAANIIFLVFSLFVSLRVFDLNIKERRKNYFGVIKVFTYVVYRLKPTNKCKQIIEMVWRDFQILTN